MQSDAKQTTARSLATIKAKQSDAKRFKTRRSEVMRSDAKQTTAKRSVATIKVMLSDTKRFKARRGEVMQSRAK
jgi:hypothetical protein